ncbi:hypothetical protein QJT82_39310 [Bradyrhizobium sp. Mp19]|nr:hypothetical protein [Bradyrhizobium elkanii]MDI2059621.1 hypothetical protein [Bradyrhizobium sp. Mp19]
MASPVSPAIRRPGSAIPSGSTTTVQPLADDWPTLIAIALLAAGPLASEGRTSPSTGIVSATRSGPVTVPWKSETAIEKASAARLSVAVTLT